MTILRHLIPMQLVLGTLALTATLVSAQENKFGEFYIKDEVKGFISIHGELRGLTDNAIGDINGTAFRTHFGYTVYDVDEDTGDTLYYKERDSRRLYEYKQFGNRILGLGMEVGARYHRLSTWFDIYFNPAQESEVPDDNYKDDPNRPLHSVKWYQYGFDWMWGYMLAPENSQVNLIPSVGFGYSVLNMQFAGQYHIWYDKVPEPDKRMETYTMGRRYYSTFGKDVVGQMEIRLNLGSGLSLGGFGGMRFTWYDKFYVESGEAQYFFNYDELVGHAWFIGGKITYTMSSRSEDKAKDRL